MSISPETVISSTRLPRKKIPLADPCPSEDPPCFLCLRACRYTGSPCVHPVDAYRSWDELYAAYFDDAGIPSLMRRASFRHWNMPWIVSGPFLQRCGYRLKHFPYEPYHEVSALVSPAKDKDGNKVFIKSMPVSGASPEYAINCLLHSDALRADPRNHTVPILNVHVFNPDFSRRERDFRVEDARAFVVMPKLMRMQTQVRFFHRRCVPPDLGACLDFARQAFEGLAFMHEHGVTHGDINCSNFLIQLDTERKPRYFFIDFQASSYLPRPWKNPPRRVHKFLAHRWSPEGRQSDSVDPFPADIHLLGGTFYLTFYGSDDVFDTHIPEFRTFIRRMEAQNPLERPTAREVYEYVVATIASCSRSVLQSPMECDEKLEELHASGAKADVMRPSDMARS